MTTRRWRNLRLVGILVALLAVAAGRDQWAPPAYAATILTLDWCENTCHEEASCNEPCLQAAPEMPAMETTCGQFDGGPANGWCDGNGCEAECQWWSFPEDACWWENQASTCGQYGEFGECGDDMCVGWQGENCATCPEDCGGTCPTITCGNSVCEPGETWRNCPQDCDPPPTEDCGDGVCGPEEDMDNCPGDCLFPGEYCGPAPYLECDSGWICVDDQCVPDDPNKFQCCGGAGCPSSTCPFGYYCSGTQQFVDGPVCIRTFIGM